MLVVDDEPLLLIELADALSAAGAEVISATRVDQALTALELRKVTAAVLDIGPAKESCDGLCTRLAELAIPFVFYSGYETPPDGWGDKPLITKPARAEDIVMAVARLCASGRGPREPSPPGPCGDALSAASRLRIR